MQWMEMHNVEYGECIVLGGAHDDILMVDCGSINQKIREGNKDFTAYVDPHIIDRYAGCKSRAFLLTHLHRDHLCGLMQILRAEPNYFQRVYLPVSPRDDHGRSLVLEFALFVYAFTAHLTEFAKVNVHALRVFQEVAALCGPQRLVPLHAGRTFQFDNVAYEVLWPKAEAYPFPELFAAAVEDLNICLSSPFLPETAAKFLDLKDRFCRAYTQMCAQTPVTQEAIDACVNILMNVEALRPQLALLPPAQDVVEILSRPVTRAAYDDTLNAAGIVFHNKRTKEASLDDLLMTGDATPAVLDEIAPQLYGGYYILKAPHHGTASHWNSILGEVGAAHILISNGDYKQGGMVAQEYLDLPAIRHCTNRSACPWFQQSGCSCNRMAVCFDQPSPGLALKCPRVKNRSSPAPCGVYVAGSSGKRSCLCDDLPPEIN